MSKSPFSTPKQMQPRQQQSLLGTQSRRFQSTAPLWSQPQQQPKQPQQWEQQQYLFTKDKAPASYSTKWTDLHPDSQNILLQIEEGILETRAENQRLDQCSRLYDSSASKNSFEHDARRILQDLGGINSAITRQKSLLQELISLVKDMLCTTAVAIRSFTTLRPRFIHQRGSGTSIATLTPGFYSGLPKKPSPYLEQALVRFEKYIDECHKWVGELEQLIQVHSNDSSSILSRVDSLPRVMNNVHDFFIHVAAKVEKNHQLMESLKTTYLLDYRLSGEVSDPFLEAERRQTAREEEAAKRVHLHPTLQIPPNSQPSTQVAGLLTGLSVQAPQTSGVVTSSTSGTSISLLGTPSSAPSMPLTSLFSTPSTSARKSLFGASSSASPQTPLFGSTPSPSLFPTTLAFGSTPAAGVSLFSTPPTSAPRSSLLGSTPSSSFFPSTLAFDSTPAAGVSLFSTPRSSLFGPSSSASLQTPLFGSTPFPSLFPSTLAMDSTPDAGVSLFSTPLAPGATDGSGEPLWPPKNYKPSKSKPRSVRR